MFYLFTYLLISNCSTREIQCDHWRRPFESVPTRAGEVADNIATPDSDDVAMVTIHASAGTRHRCRSTEDLQLVLETSNLVLFVFDLLLQPLDLVQLLKVFLQ